MSSHNYMIIKSQFHEFRNIILRDGNSGDAGLFSGKILKGVLYGRTRIAAESKKGIKARHKLLEKVAELKWEVHLPNGSGLKSQESCWTKAYASRPALLNSTSSPGDSYAVFGRKTFGRRVLSSRPQLRVSKSDRNPSATYLWSSLRSLSSNLEEVRPLAMPIPISQHLQCPVPRFHEHPRFNTNRDHLPPRPPSLWHLRCCMGLPSMGYSSGASTVCAFHRQPSATFESQARSIYEVRRFGRCLRVKPLLCLEMFFSWLPTRV